MWQHISKGFEVLRNSRIYPTLLDCPAYCALLQTCGITRPFPHDIAQLSPARRNLLAQSARVSANLLMPGLQQLDALRRTNARALQLEGPKYQASVSLMEFPGQNQRAPFLLVHGRVAARVIPAGRQEGEGPS